MSGLQRLLRRRWLPALSAAALALPAGAQCPVGTADLLDAEHCQVLVEQGEVYNTYKLDDGSKDTRGIAAKFLDVPPESVWSLITDNDAFEEFICSLTASDFDPATGINRQVLKVPFWVDIEYWVRIENAITQDDSETVWRSAWTYVEGDLDSTEGSWTLRAHGEGTLVLYEVVTDPGFAKRWIYTPSRAETELRKLLADVSRRAADPGYACP